MSPMPSPQLLLHGLGPVFAPDPAIPYKVDRLDAAALQIEAGRISRWLDDAEAASCLAEARKAVSDLAAAVGFDASRAFGRKDEVDPIDHLVGTMAGWAGQPAGTATAIIEGVGENDGETPHTVTVKDVPVDAFWSITVYNADGYLEPNDLGRNSYNNTSAMPNADGSYTINFGGCGDGRVNCIPITPGWNYAIRLYEPRPEILDGSWTFPAPTPAG